MRWSCEVDGCSGNQYDCAKDPYCRISVPSLVQGASLVLVLFKGSTWVSGRITRSTQGVRRDTRANVHAQMPVRLFPRLARRAHAVSAALGRFHAPLTAQVPPIRPLRLRTRWRPMSPLTPSSRRCPRSPPHHRHPPPTDSASLSLRPTHARQRLRRVAGRRRWRVGGRARAL